MKRPGFLKSLFPLLLGLAVFVLGNHLANSNFVLQRYSAASPKIKSGVRIVLLSDLHRSRYGEHTEDLISAVQESEPDVVVFGGDMTDMRAERAILEELLAGIGGRYPTVFAAGNHEVWTEQLVEIKETVSSYGAVVLEGNCRPFEVSGQTLVFCGTDDPAVGEKRYQEQIAHILPMAGSGCFTVAVSHRSELERAEPLASAGFDLILSGHTHGGQIRIPGLINGLFAPNAGLFPKISGGVYAHGSSIQIVSRGLTRNSFGFPRIFNPPELVLIDLIPQADQEQREQH